ncbi:Glycosyl transferases group 1 [Nonlabens sp. Hel1_33_55]|uniref:glycosyltransferase n=1 Tax=Nonlabens sp. Hel1_33_55 TaxID=1336802 RepID=UPI000875BFCF|nr:glycosyltransferase [Nonlabens sp. Hel1_33_55]SCX92795.1 Glycosyl transferases group 1 [Nonlabens sp. Hel1_33_55]
MNLLVISDAPILEVHGNRQAYAPYAKELDLWMKHSSQVTFICPDKYLHNLLLRELEQQDFEQIAVTRLEFNNIKSALTSIIAIPAQIITLYREMKKADHIHLRAPGSLTLLAGLVAILLPRKRKSVKYAGNWDPNSKQPLSYRWQKRLFSSPKWSKNTKVMAYGQWKNQSENIAPFFTASYSKTDRKVFKKELVSPVQIIFVGTLSKNKNPQLLVELIKGLHQCGIEARAHFYGDGPMMSQLKEIANSTSSKGRSLGQAENESISHSNSVLSDSRVMDSDSGPRSNPVLSDCQDTDGDIKPSSLKKSPSRTERSRSEDNAAFTFHGNQPSGVVKKAYEKAHFVFLASQSEGWPKVVAEAMWHRCIPIVTPVSCVPWMLNNCGKDDLKSAFAKAEQPRGLIYTQMDKVIREIMFLLRNPEYYKEMSRSAQDWSQHYTIEKFEQEIVKLLKV